MQILPGLGIPELLIIVAVVAALFFFGPKKLPELGNSLGKTIKNVRDGMDGKYDEEKSAPPVKVDAEVQPAPQVPPAAAPVETPVETPVAAAAPTAPVQPGEPNPNEFK